MPTNNTKTDLKQVGWYAVVHYGTPSDKQITPFFLKRVPYDGADGQHHTSYNHFTGNMMVAALFNNIYEAEKAKATVVMKLTAMNHPLKDHIKILRLFGEIVTKPKEDK